MIIVASDFSITIENRAQIARIAQLVEHDLAKVGVASSSLVSRSNQFSFLILKKKKLRE